MVLDSILGTGLGTECYVQPIMLYATLSEVEFESSTLGSTSDAILGTTLGTEQGIVSFKGG